MLEDERIKVINFLQDFGCATLKQLQILYDKPNDYFKDILTGNFVSKKGDIFIHNTVKNLIICNEIRELSNSLIVYLSIIIN